MIVRRLKKGLGFSLQLFQRPKMEIDEGKILPPITKLIEVLQIKS